jgi:3'-5' exoribonuclease
MDLISIAELRALAAGGRAEARIHGQVESVRQKETRDGKPYFELTLTDASQRATLRAWSDSPAFDFCARRRPGEFLEISGEFSSNSFGLDSKRWQGRPLEPEEREALMAGPEALRNKQRADFETILEAVSEIADPRLKQLADLFLAEHGNRFRRTAAARTYHHARRGGLVEHVAQMMRIARAICPLFPDINRDLLAAGILLHDAGKLWENNLPDDGFTMPFDERGELLGHITIGIELVNALWRKLPLAEWQLLEPASEDVRLHLLHLIAAHHGGNEFGSPVDPKTPEAWALHHIDNLDAKLEMILAGYGQATQLAPRIFERVRPLPGNLVLPLAHFKP